MQKMFKSVLRFLTLMSTMAAARPLMSRVLARSPPLTRGLHGNIGQPHKG